MVRAVWRKSRSAVSSGPKSASASTVLKSFFRLAPCNASCGGTCEKPERNQVSTARRLDCWLVWCGKTSGDLTIGSSHHLSLLELPITRWSDRQITQCHNALVSLDRCVALAHTSAKSPAPLAFCRFCPATYRPREIRVVPQSNPSRSEKTLPAVDRDFSPGTASSLSGDLAGSLDESTALSSLKELIAAGDHRLDAMLEIITDAARQLTVLPEPRLPCEGRSDGVPGAQRRHGSRSRCAVERGHWNLRRVFAHR